MYRCNLVLFGIILPSVWLGVFIIEILISYADGRISSFIEFKDLILLAILFWPVIYIFGGIVSITALIKQGLKIDALYALFLNVGMLVVWFLIKQSFLMEFELMN